MANFPLMQTQAGQGFQIPPGTEDAKDLFTQKFTELAYRAFQKTQPEMVQNVITFRVLDVDADTGTGIGTFILQHANDIVFVPCVVADNAIKPLDMFYSRTQDRFYPLNNEWLREATKGDVAELGAAAAAPKTMPTDVDIRNIVLPPTTGRYSYASLEKDACDNAAAPFAAAERHARLKKQANAPLLFPRMLKSASDAFKRSFHTTLIRSPKLAALYGDFYGVKALSVALQPSESSEKTAAISVEKPMKKDVFMLTASTPIQEARKALSPGELAHGYRIARTHGFYIKDARKNLDDVLAFAESDIGLEEPTRSGIYGVYMATGKIEKALVLVNPKQLRRTESDNVGEVNGSYARSSVNTAKAAGTRKNFVVLLPDGRYAHVTELLCAPMPDVMQRDTARFIEEITTEKPRAGSAGFFISPRFFDVLAYDRTMIDTVATVNNNVTQIRTWDDMSLRIDKRMPAGSVIQPRGQSNAMLSDSYRWFEAKKRMEPGDILSDSRLITNCIELDLERRGGKKIEVKTSSDGTYIVANDGKKVGFLAAVEKAALCYHVPAVKVAAAITVMKSSDPIRLWAIKTAAGESLDPNGAPTPEEGPQGPPPPNGLALAAGEKMQQIQGQIAALQQQMQMLSEVQQRAEMIDQGGGAMAAPAAAAGMAAGPGMLQGQQPLVPTPGGMPPQGGGMPPQGGPGDGVTPVGAPMPPQPPAPPPVMTEEAPSPQALQEQINPDFLNSAQQLQDDGVFDAAAIASLAKQKHLLGSIQTYLPSLERALDNLGRLLLLFGMKETSIKESIGTDAHTETEQNLRDVFRGLGESILAVRQYMEQLATRPNNSVY